MKNEVISVITDRYSPKKFLNRTVDKTALELLFEAACRAPSSYNEQPWYFVLASRDNEAEYTRFLNLLSPGNRQWAQSAPVLFLVVAQMFLSRNRKPNLHAWYDVGQAMGNLSIQATAMGLALHQMGGFDRLKAQEVLNIPEGYEPVVMVALGYPDESDVASAKSTEGKKKRNRKPIEEFVFSGRWGNPFKKMV